LAKSELKPEMFGKVLKPQMDFKIPEENFWLGNLIRKSRSKKAAKISKNSFGVVTE
jgi:hypothetical protein